MISYDDQLSIICYIINELTIHGTDRNPSLDEGGVDIQPDGDRHLPDPLAHGQFEKRQIRLHDPHDPHRMRSPLAFLYSLNA